MGKPHVRECAGFYLKFGEYIKDARSPREIAEHYLRGDFPEAAPVTGANITIWLSTRSFWRLLDDKHGREKCQELWSRNQARQRASDTSGRFREQSLEEMLGLNQPLAARAKTGAQVRRYA